MHKLSISSTFISLFSQYILSGRLLQNRHCKFCGCQNKILQVHSSLSEDERAQRTESPCCVFNRHLRNKSSSVLKCAKPAHVLWIYGFVCTVKFTDHEYLKPSAHLKVLNGPKIHKGGKQNFWGGHRHPEGMEESWWNESKPFISELLWDGEWQGSSLHPALNLSASLPLASSPNTSGTLGSKVIPKPPRGQVIFSMYLKLQMREHAAVTAATSTIMS